MITLEPRHRYYWALYFYGEHHPIRYQTGICIYPTKKIALNEAKYWAGLSKVKVRRVIISEI
jgi:hypothetical protein